MQVMGESKATEVGSPTLLREYTFKDGQVTFQYNLNWCRM